MYVGGILHMTFSRGADVGDKPKAPQSHLAVLGGS